MVEGLTFSYDGEAVLEDVSLSVAQGDFVAVVGPNGGGKTTLMKLCLGLLHPQKGQIKLFGLAPSRARNKVGYLPQHAHTDPSFPVTVLDVVLMGRLGRGGWEGYYRRRDKEDALKALDQVGLTQLASRPFSSLSGGQRQRVLIARALACQPQMLILDEPTANVDPSAEKEILDLLYELNRHLTVIVVSHDLAFVSPYVGHVICVNRRVVTHPTRDVTGEVISQVYGRPVHMVRHDHIGPPGGCCCE
jgi:zinc transport system ATP-binding protein